MKRYRKKEMQETVETLLKANDTIGTARKTNSAEYLVELLTQCQESAILLGTYLDTLGDKYHYLVEVLEDYCEAVYQISVSLADESQCRKIVKKIQKQLTGLINHIRYDLPGDRTEVVFLPYKASMWDSLESVWKAAVSDEQTDAYVIPIPYYDKNPDGSFREMHYEGNLYPAYVPVTHYDDYNFVERTPDVIFIHNPYDNTNYVTSVHPFFYSDHLKQYTDKLVYIPYFILQEVNPQNRVEIENIKHFITTPAVIHADRVIVQSENMRQIYIGVMMEYTGNDTASRRYWEEKILGLGSPKVDKVLNTGKEDIEIPGEWLTVIQKPDGSSKKIVLYNTSITALLEHNELMLVKMQDVFRIFQKNRDEIALLWRPHPLIESTLRSMRPQLWEEYQRIRDQYLADGWGIYDDSAELDRAVILSDAYYGDKSSVVELYRKTAKGIVIQKVYQSKIQENFIMASQVNDHENRYILSKQGVLYQFDENTRGFTALKVFCEDTGEEGTYKYMELYGEKIVLFPYRTSRILFYDLANDLLTDAIIAERQSVYRAYYRYENTVYLIGCKDKQTADRKVDLQTLQTQAMPQWLDRIHAQLGLEADYNLTMMGIGKLQIIDFKGYLPLTVPDHIAVIDFRTEEIKVIKVGDRGIRYNTVCYDGNAFWLTGDKTCIVRWCDKKSAITTFENFQPTLPDSKRSKFMDALFAKSVYWDGYVYFAPLLAQEIVCIHTESGALRVLDQTEPLGACFEIGLFEGAVVAFEEVWNDSCCEKVICHSFGTDIEFKSLNEEYQKVRAMIGEKCASAI